MVSSLLQVFVIEIDSRFILLIFSSKRGDQQPIPTSSRTVLNDARKQKDNYYEQIDFLTKDVKIFFSSTQHLSELSAQSCQFVLYYFQKPLLKQCFWCGYSAILTIPCFLGLEYSILYKGVRPLHSKEVPAYEDGEVPELDLCGEWSTPSLLLISDILSLEVVVPVWVPHIGRIDLLKNNLY